jgi:hypothetical protein
VTHDPVESLVLAEFNFCKSSSRLDISCKFGDAIGQNIRVAIETESLQVNLEAFAISSSLMEERNGLQLILDHVD